MKIGIRPAIFDTPGFTNLQITLIGGAGPVDFSVYLYRPVFVWFSIARMNVEEYCEYCLSKPGVTESFPFDENTLVFKVMGKMFALADVDGFDGINLKCDPEKAIQLRETYEAVQPGYHMNKTHWNTVLVNADAPDKKVYEWIDHSYELVVQSLSKKLQAELKEITKKQGR